MVNRIYVVFCCFLVGLSAISCTNFKAKHYAGERISLTEKDISSETVWQLGDDVYFVRLVDGNTLAAATLNWDEEKGAYAAKTYQVVLSKLGEHRFLNVKEGGYYTILRLVGAGEEEVVLFTVDGDKLEKDIADGLLNAHKEDNDIVMDDSKEALDRYIESQIGTLFSLDAAGVARLISGELK